MLGEWYKIFGASAGAMQILNGLLCILCAVECWWIAYLMTRNVRIAYLSMLLLASNPWIIGIAMLGGNVAVQSSIIGSIFLLLFVRPNTWVVGGMGIMVGLGTLARENSIFCLAAIAFCWLLHYKETAQATRSVDLWFDKPLLLRWAFSVAVVFGMAAGFSYLESAQGPSDRLLGRAGVPNYISLWNFYLSRAVALCI